LRAKSHPEAFSNLLRYKGKSTAQGDAFLGGSSTWARTRDLRINRKTGSSKIYIYQLLNATFDKRVIFRVIGSKVAIRNFSAV